MIYILLAVLIWLFALMISDYLVDRFIKKAKR